MTHFLVSFDIASIFIMIIAIMLYKQQNMVKNESYKVFMTLWVTAFISPFFDVFAKRTLEYGNTALFWIFNTAYYLTMQWIAFFFFLYALAPLARRSRVPFVKKVLFCIPILSITFFILINYFTKWFFNCNGTVYENGKYQFLAYLPSLIYCAYAFYFTIHKREVYNKHLRYAITNTFIIFIACIVSQRFYSNVILTSFGISLAVLQLLVTTIHQGITIDPYTKLLSKNAFYDRVTNLIYNDVNFNVAVIRICDYDLVLSTYGQDAVEGLKLVMCNELNKYVAKNSAYEIHEDVYAIIYENQTQLEKEKALHRIDSHMAEKWTFENLDVSFSYFVTSFEYPNHFTTKDELSNLLVYLEKTRRMRYGIMPVEEFALRDLKHEKQIEKIIADSLTNNKFEAYYQPIYDTRAKKFISSEALIRLNDSELGPIPPAEFIPIAEKSGLIIAIGDYMIEEVCKFIHANNLEELGIEYIEVNLSVIECLQRNFFVNLMAVIEKYNINPKYICFEITETAANCSPEIFAQNLKRLKDVGFKLALDDFGSGYGNLQRLVSLSFDIVKFDYVTTGKICEENKVQAYFPKMVNLLHGMNAHVVNEGVETLEQLDILTQAGTDYIQGYYFSKPVPEKDYIEFLKANKI